MFDRFFVDFPETGCQNFDVRLAYRQTDAIGNVEICINNEWQAACQRFFDQADINVTCRALGFDEFSDSRSFLHESIIPIVNNTVSIYEEPLFCSGRERSLASCQIPQRRKRNVLCDPNEVVRIQCLCKYNS